jgi:hypothetical protein
MLPPDIATASYTQWELFFARHFKRRLSIYIAKDDHNVVISRREWWRN